MSASLPLNVFSFSYDARPTLQLFKDPRGRTLLDEIKDTLRDAKEVINSFFRYAFKSNLQ